MYYRHTRLNTSNPEQELTLAHAPYMSCTYSATNVMTTHSPARQLPPRQITPGDSRSGATNSVLVAIINILAGRLDVHKRTRLSHIVSKLFLERACTVGLALAVTRGDVNISGYIIKRSWALISPLI